MIKADFAGIYPWFKVNQVWLRTLPKHCSGSWQNLAFIFARKEVSSKNIYYTKQPFKPCRRAGGAKQK